MRNSKRTKAKYSEMILRFDTVEAHASFKVFTCTRAGGETTCRMRGGDSYTIMAIGTRASSRTPRGPKRTGLSSRSMAEALCVTRQERLSRASSSTGSKSPLHAACFEC